MSERAIREELFALVLSLPLAFLIGTTMARRIEMVAVVMLVLAFTLLLAINLLQAWARKRQGR